MYLIPLLLIRLANIWAHICLRVRVRDTHSGSIYSQGEHKQTSIYIYRMFIKYKYENILYYNIYTERKRKRERETAYRLVGMIGSVVPVRTLAVPVLP